MKKLFIVMISVLVSICIIGCYSYNTNIDEQYNITEEEKMIMKDMALKLVKSRTYTILNNITDEYIEDNFYFVYIDSYIGDKFEVKFDLSEKDQNGYYKMYSKKWNESITENVNY